MVVKFLLIILLSIAIVLLFRSRRLRAPLDHAPPVAATAARLRRALSPPVLVYLLLALLMAVSLLIFAVNWHANNKIVNIRVVSADGRMVVYQARHKTIQGRRFKTLNGVLINLGESDRVEMLQE